jgi:hypothetical protein
LAAIVGMPACELNPELTVKINYEQVKNITKWVGKNQMVLIPNTNSQYGSSTEIITEDSSFNPLSLYAKTKCDSENSVLDSGNGIAMRLATVFGVSPRMRMDLLVQDFVYKSVTDGYLVLFESHFIRNYIHIRDVANTFLFMIENYYTILIVTYLFCIISIFLLSINIKSENNEFHRPFIKNMVVVALVTVFAMILSHKLMNLYKTEDQNTPIFTTYKSYISSDSHE